MNKHTLATDVLVINDANYETKASMVHFHNQGGTNVLINETLLYPDDVLEVGGGVNARFRIRFGADFNFNQDISNYPCLSAGNKLVVNHVLARQRNEAKEPFYKLRRSNTITVDALSGINVNVAIGDPTGSTSIPITGSTTGGFTIPAGATEVRIYVAGRVRDGDSNTPATVLGQQWDIGRQGTFTAQYDRTTNSYKKIGAITINGNGGRVYYDYQL